MHFIYGKERKMGCYENGCPNEAMNGCTACGHTFCAKHFCHPNSGNVVCYSCLHKNIRNQDIVGSWIFFVLGGICLFAALIWWNAGLQCLGLLAVLFFFWGAILVLLKGRIGMYGIFNKRHIPLFDSRDDSASRGQIM